MQITDTAEETFEKIALDIVVMKKEKTPRGNQYILTIQDNLTKYLVLFALQRHTAQDIFTCLLHFCCQYDIPKILLTDNGTELCSELINLFSETLNITHLTTAPYHPESNGALERAHGKLKEYLQLYVTVEKRGAWDQCLNLARSAYNKSKHAATGFSPHELVFGKKPNLPIENDEPTLTYEELLLQHQDRIRFLHECAQTNVTSVKEASKV